MNVLKKSVKVDGIEIIDTALMYSRVAALQLTHDGMKIDNVLKYELAPIPTSVFGNDWLMRPASS